MPGIYQPLADVHEYDHTDHAAHNGIQVCFKPGKVVILIHISERWPEGKLYTTD